MEHNGGFLAGTIAFVSNIFYTVFMSNSDEENIDDLDDMASLLVLQEIKRVPSRIKNYVEHTIWYCPDDTFQSHFRMS